METSNVAYEIHCNNYFKTYTGKTGRKSKERMKEHKNDGEKSRKDKNITGLSQHMTLAISLRGMKQESLMTKKT